jgi:hypothetical protein
LLREQYFALIDRRAAQPAGTVVRDKRQIFGESGFFALADEG